MEGRSGAVARAEAPPRRRARLDRLRPALLARPLATVSGIWLAWAGAVVVTVAIALEAGAYVRAASWPKTPLFPFFSWDFSWYEGIAQRGYPAVADAHYAFFPLWPWLLRASGSIADWQLGGAVALAASALAFVGVAAGSPARRPVQTGLALACWPGSFALLLAYPDALALAAAAWAAVLVVREAPLAAAPLGAAAALARPNGILIALPLALLARGRGAAYWLAAAAPVLAAGAVEGFFWNRSGEANAFFEAQRLWGRRGPSGLGTWARHLGDLLSAHRILIAVLVVALLVAILAWRRLGAWPTLIGAYVCAVPFLLAGTQSLQGFVDTTRSLLVLPLLVVLWRLGPHYRPWAAFATLVVVLLIGSGLMQSFGRQSLFAFPIFWAVAEGPPWLRYPPLAVLGFAANLGLALLLTHFAP